MFPTTQQSATDLTAALQQSKVQEVSAGSNAKAYLKFDAKSGEWLFGRDAEDVTDDKIIINTYSFQHGWILWNNRKATKKMVSFTQELPPQIDPVDGNHPSESRGFEARFEDDAETIVVFESSTYGARQGCDALLGEIKARAGRGEERFLFPVVKLESSSYQHKTHGSTIYNPAFSIVDWMDQDGNPESASAKLEAPEETETEKVAAPVRRRRKS